MPEDKKNLDLYNRFRAVPDEAKKIIQGGRLKGMTDINPMWRIKTLTENFGPCGIGWYYRVISQCLETFNNEVAAFVDIELYIKSDSEWSMPIYGTGGSKFATAEKSGIFVSDECYKMATTDALSVACKQLGIGADVYFQADKTKYDTSLENRTINDEEKKRLLSAVQRTNMKLQEAIEKYGGKSIDDVTVPVYTKWMIMLANAESVVPINESEAESIDPDSIKEETPFK